MKLYKIERPGLRFEEYVVANSYGEAVKAWKRALADTDECAPSDVKDPDSVVVLTHEVIQGD